MRFSGRNIRIVAGQHGNEKGPVRALEASGMPFELGNPKAFKKNVRFIDQDLNASYGVSSDMYESVRAQELLQKISPMEVVIDFHTTSAKGPPFVILTDKAMIPLAKRTGLTHAVLMTHNIKNGHALINVRDGISIEISGYDSEESFETTVSVLDYLKSGKTSVLQLYEVFDRINEPGEYTNFIQLNDGTFPILVGADTLR
jgi:hypothetical protein